MKKATVRTTLALPAELLEATDLIIQKGQAKNRNEFIAQALKHELAAMRRAEIDAEFAPMPDDPEYQAEALQIDAEFALASWEAFKLGESQL